MQDRACDLAYVSWSLTPIYDPDPLSEGLEGVDDGAIMEDTGRNCLLVPFDFLECFKRVLEMLPVLA